MITCFPVTYVSRTKYTIAHVQTVGAVANGTLTSLVLPTFVSNVATGDLIVVACVAAGNTTFSVSDSLGNTYVSAVRKFNQPFTSRQYHLNGVYISNATFRQYRVLSQYVNINVSNTWTALEIFVAKNSTGGSSNVVTITGTAAALSCSASNYTGINISAILVDSTNGATGSTTSISCAAASLAFPPELLYAAAGCVNASGTITETGVSWNERYNNSTSGNNSIETEDNLSAASGQSPSWTTSVALTNCCATVSFV